MITSPARPWTDPTEWRDELDDIAAMLREAGRSGPLRDEIANLLAEVGRGDRIVVALLGASTAVGLQAIDPDVKQHPRRPQSLIAEAITLKVAADIAEATR